MSNPFYQPPLTGQDESDEDIDVSITLLKPGGPRKILPSNVPNHGEPLMVWSAHDIPKLLARVMSESGLHQAEVSRRLGQKPQSLNQYVKGRRHTPTVQWLLRFLSVNGAVLQVIWPDPRVVGKIQHACGTFDPAIRYRKAFEEIRDEDSSTDRE